MSVRAFFFFFSFGGGLSQTTFFPPLNLLYRVTQTQTVTDPQGSYFERSLNTKKKVALVLLAQLILTIKSASSFFVYSTSVLSGSYSMKIKKITLLTSIYHLFNLLITTTLRTIKIKIIKS